MYKRQALSASPETPPKRVIPAAANAVCAPPPIPDVYKRQPVQSVRFFAVAARTITKSEIPALDAEWKMCIRDRLYIDSF